MCMCFYLNDHCKLTYMSCVFIQLPPRNESSVKTTRATTNRPLMNCVKTDPVTNISDCPAMVIVAMSSGTRRLHTLLDDDNHTKHVDIYPQNDTHKNTSKPSRSLSVIH